MSPSHWVGLLSADASNTQSLLGTVNWPSSWTASVHFGPMRLQTPFQLHLLPTLRASVSKYNQSGRVKSKSTTRAGEMVQCTSLAWDSSSIPSFRIGWLTTAWNFSFQGTYASNLSRNQHSCAHSTEQTHKHTYT